jgi:hypothetical protein
LQLNFETERSKPTNWSLTKKSSAIEPLIWHDLITEFGMMIIIIIILIQKCEQFISSVAKRRGDYANTHKKNEKKTHLSANRVVGDYTTTTLEIYK